MIKLDHLTIAVTNSEKSRDWYIETLGLKLEFEIPERRTSAVQDEFGFTLFLAETPGGPGRPSCVLTFQVGDVEAKHLPLVAAGLTLQGLDVSREALDQLIARRADLKPRLTCSDFRELEMGSPFDYLVAIQVFQHGVQADAESYFARTAAMLKAGGLFFLRVNSASTEMHLRHTIIDRNDFGGLTVRYDEGPKRGLCVHFYASEELLELARDRFSLLAGPREDVTERTPPKTGRWSQWEVVWQRL